MIEYYDDMKIKDFVLLMLDATYPEWRSVDPHSFETLDHYRAWMKDKVELAIKGMESGELDPPQHS